MLQVGFVLDSRYRIEEKIGNGGMGEVYRAVDTRLNIPVAIKTTLINNSDSVRAFQREAQLLSNLRHSSLPRVTDYSQTGEIQYLVMEYIGGDDLKTQLEKRQAPFNPEEVLNWTKQLLDVLGYLHNQGIQHRDIKPANIKIRDRRAYLLDFGIALGQVGEMSTINFQNFYWESGTQDFSPLEQLSGEQTTPASDIYSLAGTLYLLLTGTKPETAAYRLQIKALDKSDPLKNIKVLQPALDKNAAAAIMSALHLDMNCRPQSAFEMYWMMFPNKSVKPKRKIFRALATAAALICLLSAGIIAGTFMQQFRAASQAVQSAASEPAAEKNKISPRQEAIELTDEAIVLLQSAKYQEALKKCEQALARDETYPYAHFVYGDALWDTLYDNAESYKEMTLVQKHADRILELITSPQTPEEYTARAWANLAKEKYEIAIADATKALEIKPDLAAALMIRASARSFFPDDKALLKSFQDYEKEVQLMPNYAQARANLASAYTSLGKYELAVSELTEAIRLMPSDRYFAARGNAYFNLGKYSEARREYQEALKLDDKYIPARMGLADTFLREEDWENAVKNYSRVISVKPNLEALKNRAFAYGGLAQFSKSVKDFSDALKINENDYSIYQYRGLALCRLQRWEEAVSDFSRAIELVPENDRQALADLYEYRSAAYRQSDDEESAESDRKKASTLRK